MEERAKLKDRLQEALDVRRMKASELSDRTKVPKGAISYYLAGKSHPKADRVHILAKALDVSEAWLMGFNVPMNRTEEQKKNDAIAGAVARMRKDPEFFDVVSLLAELPPEEYASVKTLLTALSKK